MNCRYWGFAVAVFAFFVAGCGGRAGSGGAPQIDPPNAMPPAAPADTTFPAAIPHDAVQPWEELNAAGFAVGAGRRGTSAPGPGGLSFAGAERFLEGGYFAVNGEAFTLASSGGVGWAIYRAPLAGAEPGTVTVDANVNVHSEYYVGLADYGANAWDWHGPFTRNCVRLCTADTAGGADYTSPLGSVFVCVAVDANSICDVVAVGVDAIDPEDTHAAPVPELLSVTPRGGGVYIEWEGVEADDLAGYRVYSTSHWFFDGRGTGVAAAGPLELLSSHLLPVGYGETFVRVSAVDHSGNESGLSAILSATPTALDPAELRVELAAPSGRVGESFAMTASGADTYYFDLDGDGTFDGARNVTGQALLEPLQPGLHRVNVRGLDPYGNCVAEGGASFMAVDNARPFASAVADPATGELPLNVQFSGFASDPEDAVTDLSFSWDFNGDGLYEDGTDLLEIVHRYVFAMNVNARFRVTDSQGAAGVALVPIAITGPQNDAPVAVIDGSESWGDNPLEIRFDASGSYDPDGFITDYEWDFDGDGAFNEPGDEEDSRGASIAPVLEYTAGPVVHVAVRVTDNQFGTDEAVFELAVHGWFTVTVDNDGFSGISPSIAVVQGYPAISFSNTYDGYEYDLKFVRAQDLDGVAWNVPVMVDSYASASGGSLEIVNFKPAIAYRSRRADESYPNGSDIRLKYVRALDVYGGAWGSPVDIQNIGTGSPSRANLLIAGGVPVVAYCESNFVDAMYARAADEDGTVWLEPIAFDPQMETGPGMSAAVINGVPALAYGNRSYGSIDYVRALDEYGVNWDLPRILEAGMETGYISLLEVDGRAAGAYSVDNEVMYRRAESLYGDYQWKPRITIAVGQGLLLGQASMAIIGGRPAVCYAEIQGHGLMYVEAEDPAGTSWGEPEQVGLMAQDTIHYMLTELHGFPAICYEEESEDSLKFARKF